VREPHPAGDALLRAATAACIVGTIAFALYARTLLPGVDLGDTGGFQAAVLWPETSARRAYPLYYLLAKPFVAALTPDSPARGLNLFSALTAGLAVGILVFIASAVVRSVAAGAAAGALLAFAYTFWTQAVIAEVYALHLLLIGACLVALHAYARRPSRRRLGLFFAIYAVSFGNHLGMILWLVPFAVFLLASHPRPRELLRADVIGMAAAIAAAGSLLYLPNVIWTWTSLDTPVDWGSRLAAFWFDTTKADWRAASVLAVSPNAASDRIAMWWWDTQQQFGLPGVLAAAAGAARLWWIARPWALLVWLSYAISTVFTLTYNVGDPHVFFLPGHFVAAFAAAAAVAPWGLDRTAARGAMLLPRAAQTAACITLLMYGGWRGWHTYPVADRHLDRRADVLAARLASGVSESNAVLLSRLNWEPENVLLYSARYERPALAWTRLAPVLPHLPFFIRDNAAIGRDIVLTSAAAADVVATYGPAFPILRDDVPPAPSLLETVSQIQRGVPYVLTRLDPADGEPLNEEEFDAVLTALTGAATRTEARYQVWAGQRGGASVFHQASDRPFRARFAILGDEFSVRIDSWLPFDTFRRGGFGHVLRERERLLFIERGVSLLAFRPDGAPVTAYAANHYAPAPRFRIAPPALQLARVSR
jgi:hypothetical protein